MLPSSAQAVMEIPQNFLFGVAHFPILETRICTQTLAIPLYAAALSALLVFLGLLTRLYTRLFTVSHTEQKPLAVSRYGGAAILLHNIIRLLGCLTLLGLSVASLLNGTGADSKLGFLDLNLGMCGFYLYASILAVGALRVNTRWGVTVNLHLTLLLLVAFGVYFYRDIFPLGTYTWPVQDAGEGPLMYGKLVTLTVTAGIFLIVPRTYVPIDPLNTMPVNPEQTASLLSLMTFGFLDPLILVAWRLPGHLSHDRLPPLADSDSAAHLKTRGFKVDATYYGLLTLLTRDFAATIGLLLVYVVCSFASPIGINRVLNYLEDPDATYSIRPIVWILWLAFGPLIGTICMAGYYRLSMRMLIRIEGLFTELIFEHALRVRVRAHHSEDEPSKSAERSRESSDAGSTESTLNLGDAQSDASSETAQESQSTTSKDLKSSATAAPSGTVDVGKISNLVTTDLRNVTQMSDFLLLLCYMPTTIVFCVIFLYAILGWSAFVGMGVMVALFPMAGITSNILQNVQKNRIKAADARIGAITETMNVLRMIKLFGWEAKMLGRINEKREQELVWIWKREIYEWVANNVINIIPIITMLAIVMKQELRPSIVFSTMPVFDILRNQLGYGSYRLIQFIDAKVSLDRINDFLHNTELLDSFAEKGEVTEILAEPSEEIGFRNAAFGWSNESDGSATPSSQKFMLRIDDELLFKRGRINLVLGPTGAGKTSLLMALLGEMHFVPSSPNSWFNLPRAGGIAYAAQESWVLNETIRDNILFGAEYDEERYRKVLHQCALERDLELFEAGDKSEVGEKGLTLSGGQKARCTLARAIYSKAEILLLDDVLAALDVHTSKWIVDKCFSGDLVQGRTVILVTHNVALCAPISDWTISIGLNGRVLSQGSVADALEQDRVLAKEANADLHVMEQVVDAAAEAVDVNVEQKTDGKLILAEEVQLGKVKWSALRLYIHGLGGLGFHTVFLGSIIISQMLTVFETWYLGYFSSQYENHAPEDVSVAFYIGTYSLITLSEMVIHSWGDILFAFAVLRASRSIHRQLIGSILSTTLRWLDITPASRVIARFTADITAVDGPILNVFIGFLHVSVSLVVTFLAVLYMAPLFFVPGILAAILGGTLGQIYLKAQLSIKRESSNAKAPVLGQITSIRAYGAQIPFIQESLKRINKYTRAARPLANLDRWIAIRLAAIGNILTALLTAYLIYVHKQSANNVGFSLNMAAGFSMRILFWVRMWNETQIQGALERIRQYIDIEHEPEPTEAGKPPAHWPSSGELIVEKLSARYSPDGPKVLRDISFTVKAGERIGIVGRTGSGKSSLTLALLRCIYTEGIVHYDGIPTASINLDALRSNITIIPQMPELLSGTLRHNLDPFSQYDDVVLNSALRASGLFSLQHEMEEGRLTLDSAISSGGGNLSVGQRQILALGMSFILHVKVVVGSFGLDYKTDTVIQTSLRNELKSDVTVITVAHRLQTILDSDKIVIKLVTDLKQVEYDSPKALLQNPKGKLRALVDESGEKEKLYAMAEGKSNRK
ncbi:P-loop containing nucleoside triphosphate hydrolase protein [Mycena rebaudengoi]|nr:P-loop containing nucleoside triphosphate hydrolase protein [Mycena rebaudengoi]